MAIDMAAPAPAAHTYSSVTINVAEGVATLTINRPEVLNVLDEATLAGMDEAVAWVEGEPSIRALVITGAGDKAFVAGADISAMEQMDAIQAIAFSQNGQRIFNRIEQLPIPVFAAINGYALGGGCELALACDIRVASENAVFGLPEVKLGLIPGFGGTQRLARAVGKGGAMGLVLTGKHIDAQRALQMGLVNRVVSQRALATTVKKMADAVCANGGFAVRQAKRAVAEGLNMPFADGLAHETVLFGQCFDDPEHEEGIRAFIEKRKPAF